MLKFAVLACLLAVAYGGGLTGLAGQSILAAPIHIQKVITPAQIIKAPLVIPQVSLAPAPIIKAAPIVTIGKVGLGGLDHGLAYGGSILG